MLRRTAIGLGVVVACIWAINTSVFMDVDPDQTPKLIAHRGVHQIYAGTERDGQTCTASPIIQPTHGFIANTLASIDAAFGYGADVVEIDVHMTPDPVLAVFHDWTLECQTDGAGVTHKQMIADLQKLDVGFGYSVDGESYPLRGTGVGMIPTLAQVLERENAGQFLINFKSNRASEGAFLAETVSDNAQLWGIYGGGPPTNKAIAQMDGMRGFDRAALKRCGLHYALMGWSGFVPQSCAGRIIAVPMNFAPYLWGWPHKFTARMKAQGTDVILWGPYDGSGFSSGIDDAQTLAKVPVGFDGYIWTNRIEVIGPLIKAR